MAGEGSIDAWKIRAFPDGFNRACHWGTGLDQPQSIEPKGIILKP